MPIAHLTLTYEALAQRLRLKEKSVRAVVKRNGWRVQTRGPRLPALVHIPAEDLEREVAERDLGMVVEASQAAPVGLPATLPHGPQHSPVATALEGPYKSLWEAAMAREDALRRDLDEARRQLDVARGRLVASHGELTEARGEVMRLKVGMERLKGKLREGRKNS